MTRFIYFLYVVVSMSSCSIGIDNKNEKFGRCSEYKLNIVDTLHFALDSITSSHTIMSQRYENYFTFLSYSEPKRILFYELDNKTLARSINLNHIADNISGYLVHNLDSIFLFSYLTNRITLINLQGKNINSWKLPPFRNGYLMSPKVITGRPLLVKNKKLYCGGISTGEPPKGQKIITSIDMGNNEINRLLEYPYVYNQSNWGGLYYRYVYFTKSLNDNFLFSFPASHLINETHNFKDINSFYAGSCKIKSISPLKGKLLKEKRVKHFQTNYSYKSIITDPFKKVYYRIYEKPIDFKENPPWYKPCGIVVLDENLQYIGEFDLDIENISPTWHYKVFVSSQGLCVQIKSDIEEKNLSFVILSFEKGN